MTRTASRSTAHRGVAGVLAALCLSASGAGGAEPTPAVACTPAGPVREFTVTFEPALGQKPTAATVLVTYHADRLALPGTGAEPAVRQRLHAVAADTTLTPNDLGQALRVVALSNRPLTPGPLFTIGFDGCAGSAAPGAADLTCLVEGCAGSGTPISGCACAIAAP